MICSSAARTSTFSNFCIYSTSNPFDFSRAGGFWPCSAFDAWSCARMEGFSFSLRAASCKALGFSPERGWMHLIRSVTRIVVSFIVLTFSTCCWSYDIRSMPFLQSSPHWRKNCRRRKKRNREQPKDKIPANHCPMVCRVFCADFTRILCGFGRRNTQ